MKKIKSVIAWMLGAALTFAGYAATPKSESYLQTPIGDGSESGFAMTATLPDGTSREMHLFRTGKEMNSFTSEIGLDRNKWHEKFEADTMQLLKSFSKKAKFDEDGYSSRAYSFDDIGEIGKVMKEKGLPGAVCAFKNGKEWRRIEVVAQDKKYALFRFSIIDYIDEETYKARLAAKKAEEEARMEQSKAAAQNYAKVFEEQRRQQEENAQRQKAQAELARQKANEQKQQQVQNQQANRKNSQSYHDGNRVKLENYFNSMIKGGNGLNRTTVTSAELARYEQLIESGVSSSAAAQQVYNEFRR